MCRSSPGVGILIALCRLPIPLRSSPAIGSSDLPVDGALQSFLDEAELTDQESFDDERFPNVLIAGDGTVVATWGSQDLRVRRSEDGGAAWGPENPVGAPGGESNGDGSVPPWVDEARDAAFLQAPRVITDPGPEFDASTRAYQGIPCLARGARGRLWANWHRGPTPGEDRDNDCDPGDQRRRRTHLDRRGGRHRPGRRRAGPGLRPQLWVEPRPRAVAPGLVASAVS